MEIELEEYYRTKNGKIHKWSKGRTYIGNDEIVKHSKNIIDLIEVGDYLNLERVLDITGEYIRTTETIHNKSWLSSNIKTIVTHEQFSSIEYKVESEEK